MIQSKKYFECMAVALAMLGVSSAAYASPVKSASDSEDVVVPVSDVYIPSGFDSGSDSFVVVNGLFPNSCYRWKEAVVEHVSATLHEVRSVASVKPGMCMMMLMPFMHEVKIGKLEKGNHQLRFISNDGTYLQKQMNIE